MGTLWNGQEKQPPNGRGSYGCHYAGTVLVVTGKGRMIGINCIGVRTNSQSSSGLSL
ncbi:MAG: hypothetical protein K5657_07185 [Desulfovibrio sp.]|nr:hypothetical protein [Desulfovibrio sp.]